MNIKDLHGMIGGVPIKLIRDLTVSVLRLMNASQGPEQFAGRITAIVNVALAAKRSGKSEEEMSASLDKAMAEAFPGILLN